jgi:hypothetical protein
VDWVGLPAALNCEFLNTPAKGNPMKYTIEELNFAAKVRDLASAIRSTERPTPPERENRNATEFLELRAKWDAEHPVASFVPEAMARIKAVADIIKQGPQEA